MIRTLNRMVWPALRGFGSWSHLNLEGITPSSKVLVFSAHFNFKEMGTFKDQLSSLGAMEVKFPVQSLHGRVKDCSDFLSLLQPEQTITVTAGISKKTFDIKNAKEHLRIAQELCEWSQKHSITISTLANGTG